MPTYHDYPMVLNGVYLGMLGIRTDQQKYFGIPDATNAVLTAASYTTSGTDIRKKLYSNRLDSKDSTREVTVNRTKRTKNRAKDHLVRGGRSIKIPTELTSTPPTNSSSDPNQTLVKRETIRYTSIRFPGSADHAEISAWLHQKLVTHKPKYMKSPGGRSYPIIPFASANVATGGDTTP